MGLLIRAGTKKLADTSRQIGIQPTRFAQERPPPEHSECLILTAIGADERDLLAQILGTVDKTTGSDSIRYTVSSLLSSVYRGIHCTTAILHLHGVAVASSGNESSPRRERLASELDDLSASILLVPASAIQASEPLFKDRQLAEYRFDVMGEPTNASAILRDAFADFARAVALLEMPIPHFNYPRLATVGNEGTSMTVGVAWNGGPLDLGALDRAAIRVALHRSTALVRTACSGIPDGQQAKVQLVEPAKAPEKSVDLRGSEGEVVAFTAPARVGLISGIIDTIKESSGNYPFAASMSVLAGLTTGSVTVPAGKGTVIRDIFIKKFGAIPGHSLVAPESRPLTDRIPYWISWNLSDQPAAVLQILSRLSDHAPDVDIRIEHAITRTTLSNDRCVGKIRFTVPKRDALRDKDDQKKLADEILRSFAIDSESTIALTTEEQVGEPWLERVFRDADTPFGCPTRDSSLIDLTDPLSS